MLISVKLEGLMPNSTGLVLFQNIPMEYHKLKF